MSNFYRITSTYDPTNLFGISTFLITLFATIIIVISAVWLNTMITLPVQPEWYNKYNASKGFRKSLLTYLASIKQDPTKINITQLQVATANYGGIMMETKSPWITGYLTPYHGTVSKDAVRLQIDAGARAIIFDIWPDPSNLANPIVGAMIDNDGYGRGVYAFWKNSFGLKGGVSRYSNWTKLTRNVGAVGEIMTEVISDAFSGIQSEDPFYIILNLHGLLTQTYLNTLGGILNTTLGGKKFPTTITADNLSSNLCSITVDKMKERVFVVVNPDIPEGADRTTFNMMFLGTTMKEVTNLLTTAEKGTVFRPMDIGSVTNVAYTNCEGSTLKVPLPKVTLVTVQPSVGETIVNNTEQYGVLKNSFANVMKAGVQFAGVNIFSSDKDDKTLEEWKTIYKTYSFVFNG